MIALWYILKTDAGVQNRHIILVLPHQALRPRAAAKRDALYREILNAAQRWAVTRSMYLLKQLEDHHEFRNDRQKINNARKEAEALFRSKPRSTELSLPADPSPTEVSVRKPRILSAPPLPVTRMTAEAPISSEPQPKAPVSMSQLAHAHRERLKRARAAIFKQQDELQARKNAIDSELRALDAYEAAKRR